MIYDVERTARYKKAYKRMKKRGANMSELNYVVNELRSGRKLDKKYKDHTLTGSRQGTREVIKHCLGGLLKKISCCVIINSTGGKKAPFTVFCA